MQNGHDAENTDYYQAGYSQFVAAEDDPGAFELAPNHGGS